MRIIEYLQTIEAQKAIAFYTICIILIAFVLGARPFKSNKRLVVSSEVEPTWTARDYFMFLNSVILASKTWADLDKVMVNVENFKGKEFRVRISKADREKYYERLLKSYNHKVNEFESVFQG